MIADGTIKESSVNCGNDIFANDKKDDMQIDVHLSSRIFHRLSTTKLSCLASHGRPQFPSIKRNSLTTITSSNETATVNTMTNHLPHETDQVN